MSTQYVNVAGFARNVECDFFCYFHTKCNRVNNTKRVVSKSTTQQGLIRSQNPLKSLWGTIPSRKKIPSKKKIPSRKRIPSRKKIPLKKKPLHEISSITKSLRSRIPFDHEIPSITKSLQFFQYWSKIDKKVEKSIPNITRKRKVRNWISLICESNYRIFGVKIHIFEDFHARLFEWKQLLYRRGDFDKYKEIYIERTPSISQLAALHRLHAPC